MNADLIKWFVYHLTGSMETVMDWRCIHDKRKDLPAHNFRGTITEILPTLQEYNNNGYGIFCNINAMDGKGRDLQNVAYVRAHVVDLDDPLTSAASYQKAVEAGASFAVQSSAGKYHVYFKMTPYVGNEFFTDIQRKLAQLYNGDKSIIDATRVMRAPGFLHQKNEPILVKAWELDINRVRESKDIAAELAHINVVEHFATRSPLGSDDMKAPSFEWLKFALTLINPNDMDRSEWLSFSAAFKQAGWLYSDDDTLFNIWSEWCNQYKENDAGENRKLWDSIRDTEVGWKSIERRTPIRAYIDFGHKDPSAIAASASKTTEIEQQTSLPVTNQPQQTDTNVDPSEILARQQKNDFGEILSENECKLWFKDCYFIERTGEIFSPSGRFMNATKFNGKYGGKHFIISSTGKTTDEPWKAALRSTCWTIPKVDHVRFLPEEKTFTILKDDIKRLGVNIYIPADVERKQGDVSMFLRHMEMILPNDEDRKIFIEYLVHCVKYPGFKIPWAPLLQSTEGIGKTAIHWIMEHCLGSMYVYSPKASELVKSGSIFNAWMRGKLLILVNEIKIDERRELIEVLKPMISDKKVEIQSKGVDQDMEDNPANWLFFSNFKDAIPISQNGRRYSIFYSALQSAADIEKAGMNQEYFNKLFGWLDAGGYAAIAHWVHTYPLEKGSIPVRAPKTTSYEEALRISRSPLEIVIAECIEDSVPGFRGGYISTLAVIQKAKASGIRSPNTRSVQTCLENMGYVCLGRSVRPYLQEDVNNRSQIYHSLSSAPLEGYGVAQGYE